MDKSQETLFKHIARLALSQARVSQIEAYSDCCTLSLTPSLFGQVLDKEYGAIATGIIDSSAAENLRVGDMVLRLAWEHLTAVILTHNLETWSADTQDEVLEKFSMLVLPYFYPYKWIMLTN